MLGDKVQKLNSEIQKVRQQISDCKRELKDEIFNGLNQGNGRLSPQGIGLFYPVFLGRPRAEQCPETCNIYLLWVYCGSLYMSHIWCIVYICIGGVGQMSMIY